MKRILIVGTSGCGKTTLAVNLSHILNIPNYDLDDYYWLKGWQIKDRESFEAELLEITNKDQWIISGNSSNHILWTRADTIIWLDYSLIRCLYQGLKRSFKRILKNIPCCAGNYETFSRLFSKNSIIVWILKTHNKRKENYNKLFISGSQEREYLHFSNLKETSVWLEKLNLK